MTASITVGSLIDEPSCRVDYFGITSKRLDEWFHLAEPATADTVINHNVIEDISSAETILSEAVKIDGDGSGLTFRANKFLVAVGLNNKNGTDDGSRDLSSDPVIDVKTTGGGV